MENPRSPETVLTEVVQATRDEFMLNPSPRDGFVSLSLPHDLRAEIRELLEGDATFERKLKREWAKIYVDDIPLQEVHVFLGTGGMPTCFLVDCAVAY